MGNGNGNDDDQGGDESKSEESDDYLEDDDNNNDDDEDNDLDESEYESSDAISGIESIPMIKVKHKGSIK